MTQKYIYNMNDEKCIIVRKPFDIDKNWMHATIYKADKCKHIVRKIRGEKCKRKLDFMNEIGSSLQFFDEFGENWHAVKDCLTNLYEDDYFDIFTIVITKSDNIFIDEPKELDWFVQTIVEVSGYYKKEINDGGHYDRKPVVFKVIFETDNTSILIRRMPSQYHERILCGNAQQVHAPIQLHRSSDLRRWDLI